MPRDRILALIYQDFQLSMDQIRCGAEPSAAFRDHEWRVAPLRKLVAEFEILASKVQAAESDSDHHLRVDNVTAFTRRKPADRTD